MRALSKAEKSKAGKNNTGKRITNPDGGQIEWDVTLT